MNSGLAAFPLGRPARIAVLLSGRGSNFEALANACSAGLIDGEIVIVLSDRDARGLQAARLRGLPSRCISRAESLDRRGHELEIGRALDESEVDLICLAGYMRLLSADFVAQREGTILNIHPSLLPAFPGLNAQAQAIEHGSRISGCTVHLVDGGLDSGPILVQRAVAVFPTDDAVDLAARILLAEHLAYVDAVNLVLEGRVRVSGRRIQYSDIETRFS